MEKVFRYDKSITLVLREIGKKYSDMIDKREIGKKKFRYDKCIALD